MPKGRPDILEPIMKLDVFGGEENMGDVIGDLNRRRGMIKTQEPANTGIRIKADAAPVPFGYIGSLRTTTSGRSVLHGILPLCRLPEERRRPGDQGGPGREAARE